MKPRAILAAAVLALLAPPLHAAAPKPDEPFFPIMAWNWYPASDDPAVLQQMRDCGLTVVGFVSNLKHLDKVHAAGMKAIVQDPRTQNYDWAGKIDAAKARENVASLVKEVNGHPAVIGYYLRDEPPAAFFPGLATVASIVKELAPGKWPYVNLFPNYADPGQLGVPDYATYVEQFVGAVKPPVLSYDHYALMQDGSLRPEYWQNLEQMRAAARKADVPFWNIVLATAHFDYREVTHADFRFQAYSTLAYGGRGLSYFTYFAPPVGNYRMAPIDQFGAPTQTWHWMRNVNRQVLKLAPTLLKLKSDAVYHFGQLPRGTQGPGKGSLLTGVSGNGDFMAGDFTHGDGSRWVMIVNRSVTRSQPAHPQFRSPPKKVQALSAYTGEFTPFEGEYTWLAPGQGCLLKIE